MTTDKKPISYSATTTARVIFQHLRQDRWPMATRGDRGWWSTGYTVHPVRGSNIVSIDYWIGGPRYHSSHRDTVRKAVARIREWATAQGYTLDESFTSGCCIKCEVE